MDLAQLTFDEWRSFDLPTARRFADRAADLADGRVVSVEAGEHLGGRLHSVRIERAGQEFALVPGGPVTLGFDLDAWQPTAEQVADYQDSLARDFGFGPELRDHLAQLLSPPRRVTVATVLMAVADENLTEPAADTPALLAARGLRMPSPDEWEHACGAGATTLFRWGDDCPLDRTPYEDPTGPHRRPNALGLRIAYDTYRTELTSDPAAVHGGDGGESECGGYGRLLGWLPLATANRHPDYATEFVYGEAGEDMYEVFSTRPVLAL
ncbi:hypothetical protein [Kitasatospora sp. LaBMicrA B282]|uniref:hypothetical protein n=1 Tax=Kitasatospora sp. LaBMicrA B282 TaxID=3420949 RepID=UPI003D0C2113